MVQSDQFVTHLRCRLSLQLSGISTLHVIEQHGIYKWKRWYHRFVDRCILSKADVVLACSKEVAIASAKDLGISIDEIHVIHNCVDVHHLETATADESLLQLLYPENKSVKPGRVIGVISTLRWEKGHLHLFDAWRILTKQQEVLANDRLVVVGEGPLSHKLKLESKDLCGVQFINNVNDTRKVLGHLDLFVLPSINEGFGIAIIEAMAAGVPVVASNCGGIPEIIEHNVNGFLVAPGNPNDLANKIKYALKSRVLLKRISAQALLDVRSRFTPKIYVDKLISAFVTES